MTSSSKTLSRRARWGVPTISAAVLLIGAAAFPAIANADGSPDLPSIDATTLLVNAQNAKLQGVSADVKVTENLGLPSLPTSGDSGSSLTQYLSGTHTFKLWATDSGNVRIQMPQGTNETDVIKNGNTAWLWQSDSQTATRVDLPNYDGKTENGPAAAATALTPQQMATQFLTAVEPTTDVKVNGTVSVAGRDAYQMTIVPKSTTSLVGIVRIAIDAKTYVPLDVQLVARGATKPAIEVGYTKVDFSQPDSSVFNFTPPSDAKVVEKTIPSKESFKSDERPAQMQPSILPKFVGTGWDTVVVIPAPASTEGQKKLDLSKFSKEVSGDFGKGQLLHTALLNVVVLNDGRVAIGSTNEATLLAAIPAE